MKLHPNLFFASSNGLDLAMRLGSLSVELSVYDV